MKIAIIGCPGSGKSTVAKQLNKQLNIPLYHLDQYYWLPNWQRPNKDAFEKIHNDLCNREHESGPPSDPFTIANKATVQALRVGWIIEGMAMRNLAYRIEQADVIIFLDIPLHICFYRIFKRALFGFGTIRDTSAPGCHERFPDHEFLSYVWNFNRKHKPMIESLFKQHHKKKIFTITDSSEINNVIRNVVTLFDDQI